MEIEVVMQPGQSLMDISLQYYGSLEGVFAIAKVNDLSITTEVDPGTKIKVPLPDRKPEIVNWLETENIIIAASGSPIPGLPEGIGNEYLEYPDNALTIE